MTVNLILFLVMMASAGLWPGAACAEVEWNVMQTFELQSVPVEVAIPMNGRTVFVLNDRGEVEIYNSAGQYRDKIVVGKDIDGIKPTPRDDVLIVTSTKNKTLQVITLSYVQTINTQDAPVKGPADAPVELVVFSDFECSACARLVFVLEQVIAKQTENVKVVFKHYPLQRHRYAQQAAAAAVAAGRQDRFWDFHDVLFENFQQLNADKINEIAELLGLDQERLQVDMKDAATSAIISRDMSEGKRLGVRGTPTVFVNGRLLHQHTLEGFEAAIAKALSEAASQFSVPEPAANSTQ